MNQAIKERIEKIKRGEVPEGYKRTRAGISPIDWDVKPSTNFFSIYNDKNHNGDLTVLSASQEHGIIPRDEIDIDIKYNPENLKTYKKVQPGDFVISLRSFQGGIEYSEHLGLVSPAYTVLKSKPGVFDGFYRYYFKTIDFISRLNSTIYGIRDGKQIGYEDFSTLLIHNPPLHEQEKIAEILSTWDKAILLMENLIEEKKKQKKWLMQNLLNPDSGVRLPGFEESEWKYGVIKDLAKIRHGKNQKDVECLDGIYPILASGGEIGRTNTFLYDKPSVLIGRKGSIDKPVYIDSPFWTVDTLFYSEISNIANPKFVYYYFCSINWWKYNESTGVPSLSASTIEAIDVVFPIDYEVQTAIANVLSTADKEIDLLEQELEQLQKQKKALMQLLLTGIVRVTI